MLRLSVWERWQRMDNIIEIKNDLELNKTLENNRLSLDETKGDIAKRMIKALYEPTKAPPNTDQQKIGSPAFSINGNITRDKNAKGLYLKLLKSLSSSHSDFYDLFSKEQSRSRRFIAKQPHSLYKYSPHLAKEFADEIDSGWWVDTNLSKTQIYSRAETACRVLGLEYGIDLVLNL